MASPTETKVPKFSGRRGSRRLHLDSLGTAWGQPGDTAPRDSLGMELQGESWATPGPRAGSWGTEG